MKSRSAWIVSTLIAGAAFTAAFFAAREMKSRQRPAHSGILSAVASAAERPGAAGADTKATTTTPSPAGVENLYDEVLQKALTMPDLAEAIRYILANEGIDYCADSRLIRLVELLPVDRLAELAGALEAQKGRTRPWVLRYILGAWAQRDATGAVTWVEGHEGTLTPEVMQFFLRGWMRGKPEGALAWLNARPFGTGTGALRTAVVEALAETNPDAALTLMKDRGWIAENPAAVLKLMHNWGGADPQSALAGLRKLMAETKITPAQDPDKKSGSRSFNILLRALLHGAFDRNPADAAALLSGLTPEEYPAGSAAFAQEVLARDPDAAAVLFAGPPDEKSRPLILQAAATNPSLVLSHLQKVEDRKLREDILFQVPADAHSGNVVTVPAEAQAVVSETLAGMTDRVRRFAITGELCRGNAATSPQWAAELWNELPEGPRRETSMEYFRGLGAATPDLALTEYKDASRAVQESALRVLAHSLAATRPEEALELVLKSKAPDVQHVSAATLFCFWAQSDQAAALAALEQSAGKLDLKAVAGELKNAGVLPVYHGFTTSEVSTAAVAEKINSLLGTPVPPAR